MRLVWAARWPGVWMAVRQGLGNVPLLVRDLGAVGWCQLRRQHYLEPDPRGRADAVTHNICEHCWWCLECERRRLDIRDYDLVERAAGQP